MADHFLLGYRISLIAHFANPGRLAVSEPRTKRIKYNERHILWVMGGHEGVDRLQILPTTNGLPAMTGASC